MKESYSESIASYTGPESYADGGNIGGVATASLEDKIVQQAVLWVIQCIYERDFLGFSYGYRPGKSQHQALDALSVALT